MAGLDHPLALARALIRCPSVTPADGGALDVLQTALESLGFSCHRVRGESPASAPVDNLYARRGAAAPNFCFAGHTDVVPVGDRDGWSVDPFAAVGRDGKLYGRGASDMKGAIAAFTAAAARFFAAHPHGANGSISLLGFVVQGPDGGPLRQDSDLWRTVRKDLLRLKWLDERTLNLAYRHPEMDLTRAEIIIALCHLVHQVLVRTNPYAFELDRITRLAERNLVHATRCADLSLQRFDPSDPLDDEPFQSQLQVLREQIDNEVDLEEAQTVLSKFLDAIVAVRRTNVYLEDRYALAFRLDPQLLADDHRPDLPYGVTFVHGRSFNGFHVRFRDIARGGVRVVRTVSADQHARETERLYDEAYHLALLDAQVDFVHRPYGAATAPYSAHIAAEVLGQVLNVDDRAHNLIFRQNKQRDWRTSPQGTKGGASS